MSSVDQNAAEFIAEAQEVIETFSRTLLELEAQSRTGSTDPDLLNAAFRAIHSLKGLAGLFGERMVWGSDWPHPSFAPDQLPAYASMLEPVRAVLGEDRLDAMLHGQARTLYF